jgi:hypothetical protein
MSFLEEMRFWEITTKGDPECALLADRHYSRRTIGSPQFMPPGQTIILKHEGTAVFGWHRPHPNSGIKQWNKLDGWTCTIFRNESNHLSSEMILEAEKVFGEIGMDVGPDGFITYVWDSKVKSDNPGYCFKRAGWCVTGRSADNKKTLLQKEA